MTKANVSNRLKLISVLSIFAVSINVNALNIGRMTTNSMHGEPLDADIILLDAPNNLTASKLKIALASDNEFSEIGLSKDPMLGQLNFTPYQKNGNWYIKVKSDKPISKTFVDFLLTVKWPQGRVMREYMTILKSPVVTPQETSIADNTKKSEVELATTKSNKKEILPEMLPEVLPIETSESKESNLAEKTTAEHQDLDMAYKQLHGSNTESAGYAQFLENMKNDLLKQFELDFSEEVDKSKVASNNINNTETKPKLKKLVTASKAPEVIKSSETNKADKADKADIKPVARTNKSVFVTSKQLKVITETGDSLWKIAAKYSNDQATIIQVMQAIYNKNKGAFINSDADLLMQGQRLIIPTSAIAAKYSNNLNDLYDNRLVASNKMANKSVNRNKNIIRIAANGSLRGLNISEVAESIKDAEGVNNIAAKSRTDILDKFTTAKSDLMKLGKPIKTHENKAELEILSKDSASLLSSKPDADFLLAAELLVAKQKENQELREQMLLLKAQLADMQKLAALNKQVENTAKSKANINNNITTSQIDSDLFPFDLGELSSVNSSIKQDLPIKTKGDTLVNNNNLPSQDIKSTSLFSGLASASDSISNYIGTTVPELPAANNQTSNTSNNSSNTLVMWLWLILFSGAGALLFVYYYWSRYYRIQPEAPVFMSDVDDIDLETVSPTRAHSDNKPSINDFEMMNDEEVNSSLDLVKAYIELNDYENARKILDVVMKNGNNEQRSRADSLMQKIASR